MKKQTVKAGILLGIVYLFISKSVFAAEELTVSHKYISDDKLCVYIENPESYEEVKCQIGQEYSEEVSVKKILEPEVSVDTYLLIDNSLSIQEKYRDTMKQVAKNIVLAGNDYEQFTIATFDTELHYLAENSASSQSLIECIDQITFQDQETNVFDVLYRLYDKMESDEEDSFKRIIFMSDGVETKKSGYTREELLGKAGEEAYPVYVLGCAYQSNETELENMFSISRETNAVYYYLENMESAEQIVAGIKESFDYIQVQVVIPEAQQDGALKGVKLTFDSAEGEKTASFRYEMPFWDIPDESESMTNDVLGESDVSEENEEAGKDAAMNVLHSLKSTKILIPSIIGAVIGIIIVAAVIATRKKKGKREGRKYEKTSIKEEHLSTEFLGEDRTEMLDDDATGMADVLTIRLVDVQRSSQIREYSLDSSLILGRSSDKAQIVFDYEKSISSQHCEIYRMNDHVYIRDLHSSNGTYVDGIRVGDEVELENGSIIKLGRLQVEFQRV